MSEKLNPQTLVIDEVKFQQGDQLWDLLRKALLKLNFIGTLIPTCGPATLNIQVMGAGTAAANGLYTSTDGGVTFVNSISGYFITANILYRFDATSMYNLGAGQLFPCGTWTVAQGAAPSPTMNYV